MTQVETEIKLLASPAALDSLQGHPLLAGEVKLVSLVTTYFDTSGGNLRGAGASLRLRSGDGEAEQTFKHSGGDQTVRRQEWNAPATGDRPDPARFPPEAAAALAQITAGQDVAPFATICVERRTHKVRHGASLIEVAFDRGTIAASDKEASICELELEVIEGTLADALQLALALPLGPDLRWSVAAKGNRAFALAQGEDAAAVRAADVVLTPVLNVAQAFRAISWSCLDHLLGNYGLVVASQSNAALHQSRVAIRRLRAVLGIFADSIDEDTATRFRTEFGNAATAMGTARELHVLLEAVAKADQSADPDRDGALVAEFSTRRDTALAKATEQLGGETFQRLLFQFGSWIETVETNDATINLPEFAARALDRHRRKVKHAARHFHTKSDHELHRLRIKVKKLRYAVEFFTGLAATDHDRAATRYATKLGKLQDLLGLLHDLSERTVAGPLFADYDPARAAELYEELERRLGPAGAVRDELMDRSAKALAKLLALPAWWQGGITETDMGKDKHGRKDEHEEKGDGKQLRALQIELSAMQHKIIGNGARLLVILEGRDAAGKDGTIKRIVEHMSPHATRVVALGVPSDRERKAWYFQRWCAELPVAGEIVFWNRSWYSRAGVERVMGFCTDAEYEEFMSSVGDFEQLLVRSGMTIIKYYLDVSKREQKRRLHDRETDPLKQWKISPIDKKATKNWDKYSKARNAMLARTHSVLAPWIVIKADDKPKAHLALIRDLLARSRPDPDGEILPDPHSAFIYDAAALQNGWLAE